MTVFKKLYRWGKRAFLGDKELSASTQSPSALIRKAFFRKKGAVVALVTIIALFLFVFIAPAFVEMNVNDSDPLGQNIAPGYGLSRVPKRLKKQIETIDGFAGFTVGLSKTGEVFVWGLEGELKY